MGNPSTTVLPRSPLLRTVEGERLLALAEATAPNEVLTYERVRAELGFNPQSNAGRSLWSKVQAELESRGMQFSTEPKIGYRRHDDDGKVDKAGRLIGQAARRARAAGRVVSTTERAKLSEANRARYDLQRVCASIMEQTARVAAAPATQATAPSPDELQRIFASVRELR